MSGLIISKEFYRGEGKFSARIELSGVNFMEKVNFTWEEISIDEFSVKGGIFHLGLAGCTGTI